MHSIIYTAATLLASLSALAAPAPAPASDIVVFGRYNTYSDTNCVDATQTGIILSGPQCRALPDNSVYADFDNEAGTHFALFYDSSCQSFAQDLPLNTCVDTSAYLSIGLVSNSQP